MSWFTKFVDLFRPGPSPYETLYLAEKQRADGLYYKLLDCENEKSIISELFNLSKATISQINKDKSALESQINNLELKLNDLEKSLGADIASWVTEKGEMQAIIKQKEKLIDNLTKQKDDLAAQDITPGKLTPYLKDKYKNVADRSKIWDEWDSAVMFAFAVEQTEDAVILSAKDFKDALVKAFPDAVWHSDLKDNEYYACSMNQAEIIIRNDFGNLKPYVPEKYDCDKFAQGLRVHFYSVYGYNIAVEIWGNSPVGFHSWLLIRCWDGILMVEPQNDSIIRLPGILPGYKITAFHDA